MMLLQWFIVVIALVVGVYSVCVLSSQISRREEGDQCEDL